MLSAQRVARIRSRRERKVLIRGNAESLLLAADDVTATWPGDARMRRAHP